MYRQLLYSAGGGIISNEQKAKQASCVTLAIGLGGTGIDCLRRVKRMVYEQLEPDDPNALVPSYSHIKFLAVDTDRSCLEDDGLINNLDRETEFFDISRASENIGELLKDSRNLAGIPELQWLKLHNPKTGEPGIRINSERPEASGIRQIGRFFMIEKSDAFVQKVCQLITEAKRGFPKGIDVNVHIFSGLSGATGSGIFLDVCYLVQYALDEIGEGLHAITSGYFFLPDVNLSLPQIASRQDISRYIQANGYAAMKELDYCMGLYINGGYWKQEYRGFTFGPVKEPPVKICYLISAGHFNGQALANGYENAMNAVGEHVVQFLVNSDFNMAALACAHMPAIDINPRKHGAIHQYFALGASSAVVPIREISTYLGSKLFESFSDFRAKYPANEEIAQFAKENGLNFQGLLKLVMDKTSFDMTIVALWEKIFRDSLNESDLSLPNELILPDGIMRPFQYMRDRMAARVETNIAALTQDWRRDRIRENERSISRVWKVYYALEQLISDPDKGPFYAATVLYGLQRTNLVDILQEDLEMTRRQLRIAKNDLSLRLDAVKKARSAYLHPRLLQNRQRLFDRFIEETAGYFELTARILVLEKMQGMILKMMEQFKDLYRIHFELFMRVYDELLETFHENYQVLTDGVGFRVPDDRFMIYIPEQDDHMKVFLDRAIENLDLAHEAGRFNSGLFNAYDVWGANDGRKIAKFVSDYLDLVFYKYTNKTITKYLEMRFNTDDWNILTDRTYREVLRPLNDMAVPLFQSNPSVNQYYKERGYISIFEAAPLIRSAANKLIDENCFLYIVKNSNSYRYNYSSRIRILRYLCGLPMYAYNGTDLFRKAYMDDSHYVGRHIYEGTDSDPRDWRKLPDPIPFSVDKEPTKKMLENEKKYFRAVECGIIHAQDPEHYSREYHLDEYEGIDEIESLAKRAAEECDRTIAKEVLSKIEDYLQNRQPVNVMTIPNDGSDGVKEIVRKDYVMGSYVYIDAIERQLGILDSIDRIKASMELVLNEVP